MGPKDRERATHHEDLDASLTSVDSWLYDVAHISNVQEPLLLPMDHTLAEGRLQLIRRIGSGGMGVVYEAYDRTREACVAVKLLALADPDNIYRLKNEFRSLTELRHPNLVYLHELFAEHERWYFTMELVSGLPFNQYVGVGPAVDLARLRGATLQLLEGVRALHGAGRIHRDLKPANVLVTNEARAVVLDFGLSIPMVSGGAGRTRSGREIAGTPAYMAPEQAAGEAATAASDLYAVGVMLFETLTGVLPGGREDEGYLSRKKCIDAPRARDLCPSAPDVLDALCAKLLDRDPHRRGTVDELMSALGSTPTLRLEPDHQSVTATPLFGRASELATLRAAYAATLNGRAVLCAVCGPSGIGKTALVESFLRELEGRAVVLRARCYERDRVPFKAIDPLVDSLARYFRKLSSSEIEALLPRDIRVLSALFPALERVEAVSASAARAVDGPSELHARSVTAFVETLARIRDRSPLVVHIDDLQWACRDSLAFLRQWLTRRDPAPVMLVTTWRLHSQSNANDPAFELLRASAGASQAWASETIMVGDLPEDDLRALVRSLRNATSGDDNRIAVEARGSPLVAQQLSQPRADGGTAPRTFADLLAYQVSRQSPSARALLELLATIGVPIPSVHALEASGASQVEVDALAVVRLVHESRLSKQAELECAHDRIREQVCAALSKDRMRLHSSKLAAVLARFDDSPPELLSCCYEASGELRLAAREAERAGDAALDKLAFHHAAHHFQRALSLEREEREECVALTVKLGTALARAGRSIEAAAAYLHAVERSSGIRRLNLKRQAVSQLAAGGDIARGRALLDEVCREAGVPLPKNQLGAAVQFARDFAGLRARGFARKLAVTNSPRTILQLDTAYTAVCTLADYEAVETWAVAANYLKLALQAGDSRHITHALSIAAVGYSVRRPNSGLPRLLLDRLMEYVDDPFARAMCALVRGGCAFWQGRLSEARPQLWEALRLLQDCAPGSPDFAAALRFDQATTNLLGDYRRLVRLTPLQIEQAYQRGDVWTGVILSSLHGVFAQLVPHAPAACRKQLAEAESRWKPAGKPLFPDFGLLIGHTTCHRYEGNAAAALELLAARREAYARSFHATGGQVGPTFAIVEGACAVSLLRSEKGRASRRELILRTRAAIRTLEGYNETVRPFAFTLRAAISMADADVDAAIAHLRRAVAMRDALQMTMFAATGRRRLGQLVGGDEGRALVQESEARMRYEGTADIEALTNLLCPGCQP